MIVIRWNNKDAGGSTDYLSPSLFEKEGQRAITHDCIWQSAPEMASAEAIMEIDGDIVYLDYRGSENNQTNGIDLIKVMLTFSDESRSLLKSVHWLVDDGTYRRGRVTIWHDADCTHEGGVRLVEHLMRERDANLRASKLAQTPDPSCEICAIRLAAHYGVNAPGYEIHHRLPIAHGPRVSRLEDLAILCPTCHRAIHRTNPLMPVEAFSAMYRAGALE